MAQGISLTSKRLKIDKANTALMVIIGVAAAVAVFTLVASKTLLSQYSYQKRVIAAKNTANNQLIADYNAATGLVGSYKSFVNTSQNVLGGNSATDGVTPNDGNNATIILDALPSQYDFPGLVSTINNILTNANVSINAISGTDEQLTEGNVQTSSNPSTQPMPFEISVDGPYANIQGLINTLQLSIRPINIQTISLSAGTNNTLAADITADTYFQPPKNFSIGSETIQ